MRNRIPYPLSNFLSVNNKIVDEENAFLAAVHEQIYGLEITNDKVSNILWYVWVLIAL